MKKFIAICFLTMLFPSLATGGFIDNGNGTVTDTSTGLMWQQDTAPGSYNWQQALAYCESLTLAGHHDWRLPNRNELQSLIDYNRYNPAINTDYFPDTVSCDPWPFLCHYWSSTTLANNPYYAWVVYFYDGYVGYNYKSGHYYVRAVRGGQGGGFGDLVISSFTANPLNGNPPLSVDFNCQAYASGGYITEYRWDFDGDGIIDETTSGNTVTHVYQQNGGYYPNVIVVDNRGQSVKSYMIPVTAGNSNQPLSVSLSISRIDNNNTSVTFQASCTGNVKEYRWDFDGNGIVDETTLPFIGQKPHYFSQQGRFTTILKAVGVDNAFIQTSVRVNLEATQPAILEGYVLNKSTNAIIPEAIVTIGAHSIQSDANGHFVFSNLTSGSFATTVLKSGFRSFNETVTINPGNNSRKIYLLPITSSINKPKVINVNLYRNTIDILEEKEPVFLNGVNLNMKFKPDIDWGSGQPGTIYFITPKGTYTGNEKTLDVGTEFGIGGNLKIVAVNTQGVSSDEYVAPFRVVEPPLPGVHFYAAGDHYELAELAGLHFLNENIDSSRVPPSLPVLGGEELDFTLPIDIFDHLGF
jgi:hypothetical protein